MLLPWGVAWATTIAAETAGLDDRTAEESTYPRQKALRRLLRAVSQWAVSREELQAEEQTASLILTPTEA